VVVYRSLCQGQFTRIGRMLAANAKPAPPVPTVAEAATEAGAGSVGGAVYDPAEVLGGPSVR
jgi:hypothetical protein